MVLMVAVGGLMVSTIRFPSSKQPMNKLVMLLIAVGIALLAWLQMRFFVLFFLLYISVTLLINIGWQLGWRGLAPPRVSTRTKRQANLSSSAARWAGARLRIVEVAALAVWVTMAAGQQLDERAVERLARRRHLLGHRVAVGRRLRQRDQLLHAAQLAFDARQPVHQILLLLRARVRRSLGHQATSWPRAARRMLNQSLRLSVKRGAGDGHRDRFDAAAAGQRNRAARQLHDPCEHDAGERLLQLVGDSLDHQAQVFGGGVGAVEQAAAAQRRPGHRRNAEVLQAVEGFVEHRRRVQRRELDLVGGQRDAPVQAFELVAAEIRHAEMQHLARLAQQR